MTRLGSITLWFGLTILASTALYHTSYQVQDLNQQLRKLNTQIEAEQRNLHVMRAEWVMQAGPGRVEKMAQKHLGLKPAALSQIITLAQLSERLPTREERLDGFKLDGVPLANVNLPQQVRPSKRVITADARTHINTRMVMARTTDRTINLPNGGLLRFNSRSPDE